MVVSIATYGLAILALLGASQGIPQYRIVEPDCPQFCPANYAPVCGSDGQTYSNECALGVASCEDPSITKATDGQCGASRQTDCPQVCPQNYAPVCGSDGQTYSNDCALGVAACEDPSITKASDGDCGATRQTDCPQLCPAIYAPVCGSDGQTYSNECALRVAACEDPSITIASNEECGATRQKDCPQVCPQNYAPVCGSDGQTYSNDCALGVAACEDPSITKASDGECGATRQTDCPQICPANYAPVCGSDGQTYSNDCELSVAACEDPSITRASDGECGDTRQLDCLMICLANDVPVCGSNGQTYGNECGLNAAACEDPSIQLAYEGECKPECPQICTANYDPVCGSDGQTYGNDCELNVASCEDPSITKEYDGECQPSCPQICPANFAPVCGSNGQTYSNECLLNVASCRDQSITKASDGPCGIKTQY